MGDFRFSIVRSGRRRVGSADRNLVHEAVNEIKLAQLVLAEPRLAVGLEPRFDIVQKSDAVGVAFNALLDLQADAVHKLYRAA